MSVFLTGRTLEGTQYERVQNTKIQYKETGPAQ